MTTLTIDKAGRVVIPKPLRDALHLKPEDHLKLERSGEEIILSPVHDVAPLQKEYGTWVYRTGTSLREFSIADGIEKNRDERQSHLI